MKSVSYYVGLDVQRKSISYSIKRPGGMIVREGKIEAQRQALWEWAQGLGSDPWSGGPQATISCGLMRLISRRLIPHEPRFNPKLGAVYQAELAKGHRH